MSKAIIWIRFERHRRYHAIYAATADRTYTYCDRSTGLGAITDATPEPPDRCQHCRQRIARPWLISQKLQALKGSRAATAEAGCPIQ
jgi:hypothetical protein